MNNDKDNAVRQFERHMRKEHGLSIDNGTEAFYHDLRKKDWQDSADVIVSHVDKAVPKALLALGPPLTIAVLYLTMKTTILAHPLLVLLSVCGMLSAFFFAIKYDHSLRILRYCNIARAKLEEKNLELRKQIDKLLEHVGELEGELSALRLKDEDIPL